MSFIIGEANNRALKKLSLSNMMVETYERNEIEILQQRIGQFHQLLIKIPKKLKNDVSYKLLFLIQERKQNRDQVEST